MKLFDCHCHTERSDCAEDVTLEWYAEIARNSSQVFAITDHSAHIYYPREVKWAFWTDEAREVFEEHKQWGDAQLDWYVADVRAAQAGGMLLGIELDMFLDGTPVCNEDRLGDFDILLGAAHTFPALQQEADSQQVEAELKVMIQRLAAWEIDVLAHPFRPLRLKNYSISDDLIKWVVDVAGEHDIALEINSHSICRDEDICMARLAYEQGVALAAGTDAHRKVEFGDFSYHYEVADAVGVAAPELYWRPAQAAMQAAK